jgi:hypothetical protein
VKIDLADPLASADRCAKAIDTISLSREERLAMAEYAARNYDWEAMARGLIKLAASGHRATS